MHLHIQWVASHLVQHGLTLSIKSFSLSYSALHLHLDAVKYPSQVSALRLDIIKQACINHDCCSRQLISWLVLEY